MGNKFRNSFVKQQITDTLLQLLEERELTEIAIHEKKRNLLYLIREAYLELNALRGMQIT
ncbi:hypothetical protein [Paenibacillus dakarensis]|uniref:hypothetical protein n=1 Tax=Paenibacillus dakarensis TaxID=1527293 RepID=UPI0006D583CE|nr:hypothetical protein [Paenibacillus dakarensis]